MNRWRSWFGVLAPDSGPARLCASSLGQRLTLLLALLMLGVVVAAPLDLEAQMLFTAACMAAALVLRRHAHRLAILAMITLSVIASLRYMYWRLTSSLGFENPLDMLFGYGLVLAELYALLVLLLGYLQTAWPLQRKPYPLPRDTALWPTVDVYIPTYNEPLEIIKLTAFAAQAIDWPKDKLNVYVLDDGRREEFRAFCAEAGIGYIIRPDNFHAKAGNLNHALALMEAEAAAGAPPIDIVAVLDCDHVPLPTFLTATLG
ncbi:MAG: glycosyltransferase, partial [Pseudomonadaceae bacterium]|nr:glycosyltransferase [Pseudomonadaceae bacterium]